jgi:hypothetical protein
MSANHPTPFRLIDAPFDPPAEVQERSRIFVANMTWTFASTMAWAPHEYIVRGKTPRALRPGYDQLFADTHEFGWRGRFGRTVHRYLSLDGLRYWSCDGSDCQPCRAVHIEADENGELIKRIGCVINRANNSDLPAEQLRLEVDR